MTSDVEILLAMIAGADAEDTIKMDEIDARTECFYLQRKFLKAYYAGAGHLRYDYFVEESPGSQAGGMVQKYTRSRDALKDIRPEGYVLFRNGAAYSTKDSGEDQYQITLYNKGRDLIINSAWCATEELAELHAIIQATEYERRMGDHQING